MQDFTRTLEWLKQGFFVANGMVFPRHLGYINEQQNRMSKPRRGLRMLLRKSLQSVKNIVFVRLSKK